VKKRTSNCQIGVMGSSNDSLNEVDCLQFSETAERLGAAIARHGCLLVTGATTGLPDLVSRAARRQGGLTVGISPASSAVEHVERFRYPLDGVDVMIYTGFGLKGRNVVNIRSSDIVVIFGGGMGTLNEFTIAYDEGKVIGILEGIGGMADHLREVVRCAQKPTTAQLIYASEPERLIEECLAVWHSREAEDR
jgi:uncharacterized protein (TIGR00725 family)